MVQAQYSQSNPSQQQLQQCLDAFQGQSLGTANVADSQRRSVLTAQAMHFLQPQDVQVGLVVMYSLLTKFRLHTDLECTASTQGDMRF